MLSDLINLQGTSVNARNATKTPDLKAEKFLINLVLSAHGLAPIPDYDQDCAVNAIELGLRHHLIHELHFYIKHQNQINSVVEKAFVSQLKVQLLNRTLLKKICVILRQESKNVLVFKGLAVQQQFYEGRLRHAGDIDLLVTKSEFSQIVELLSLNGLKTADFKKVKNQESVTLLSSSGASIDLHTILAEPYFCDPNVFSIFNKESESFFIDDVEIRTLPKSYHLLALMLHGFKHQWCRMFWLVDILLLLNKIGPSVVSDAYKLAQKNGLSRVFLIGLGLIEITFGQDCIPQYARDPVACQLAKQYRQRLFLVSDKPLRDKFRNIKLHLAGLEGIRARGRYLAGRASNFAKR